MNNGNYPELSQEDIEYLQRQDRLLDAKLITKQEYQANRAKIMEKYQPKSTATQTSGSFDAFGFGAPEQTPNPDYTQPQQAANQSTSNQSGNEKQMPMKWYKFLIYFALIIGPVLNLISGIRIFTFKNAPSSLIVSGVISIALAIFGIITRQALANKKKNGPTLLLTMYAVGIVSYILSGINFGSIVAIITTIVIIVLNKIYFDKRKHIFTK